MKRREFVGLTAAAGASAALTGCTKGAGPAAPKAADSAERLAGRTLEELREEHRHWMLDDFDAISISLGATDNDDYKNVRGDKSSFDDLLANIINFCKRKIEMKSDINITINVVKTRQNYKKIKKFKKMISRIDGVDTVLIRSMFNWSGFIEIGQMRIYTIERKLFRFIFKIYKKVMLKIFKRPLCTLAFVQAAILWNGDVVPCCMDFQRANYLGNVNETRDFREIWDGKLLHDLQASFMSLEKTRKNGFCYSCIFDGY